MLHTEQRQADSGRGLTSMRPSASLLWLAAITMPFVFGGATCARRQTIQEFQPPIVFSNQPTLAEITQHVNRSLAINQLESNNLTVNGPEIPQLRGGPHLDTASPLQAGSLSRHEADGNSASRRQ